MSLTIDRWGNRSKQTGSGGAPTHEFAVSGSSNRITTTGYVYDDAGRMTNEPGKSYQYDAEGRLTSVNSGSLGTHGYDGDGRRVKKTAGGSTRHYFRDAAGAAVWEYKQGAQYPWDSVRIHFNGRLAAVNSVADGLLWTHLDHLGTPRIKTDSTGLVPLKLGQLDRDWYFPDGEQINTPVDAVARCFTGQERDFESSLDHFSPARASAAVSSAVPSEARPVRPCSCLALSSRARPGGLFPEGPRRPQPSDALVHLNNYADELYWSAERQRRSQEISDPPIEDVTVKFWYLEVNQ